MKTPTYETSGGALAALFNANTAFAKADLYTWTFQDGTVLRTTDADVTLTLGARTFASCAPAIVRGKVSLTVGVEVDSVDVTVMPKSTDTVGGLAWATAARLGYLDGATLLVETAYLSTWPTVVGALHVFQGQVSDIYPDRSAIRVTVKSATELLAQQFPRNVYQSVCLHTVYDAGCGVNKASFTFTNTIVSSPAPTLTSFKCSLAQAAGYFDQGVVTFTSGANAGLKRTVKSYDGAGGFTFALPLPVAPAAGDTISVFAGCDKLLATCTDKFANAGKFRGFPWVPTPEQATPPIAATTTQSGK
jgi:uncharacterized phage protein (TIGR02218 family)